MLSKKLYDQYHHYDLFICKNNKELAQSTTLVEQELFTFPEHMSSPQIVFLRG
jgi:hypothetical protein